LGALGIDGLRLLWQIINFLILLYLLQRLLFKPVLRLMDQRAERIRTSVDEADRMRQLAEETRLANERALDEARGHAAQIIENANRMAEQFRQSQMDAARREAELFTERARDEIRLERDQAIADVRHQAVDLAILAAGKVIEQQLNVDQHRQLVTQFLAQAGATADNHP
jgi:F-type H+-transporting ATPase subunit b